MSTVPTPTDRDISAALARIDEALAAIEDTMAERAREMQALKAAYVRRDIRQTVSFLLAGAWLVAVVILAIYGTVAALGGGR